MLSIPSSTRLPRRASKEFDPVKYSIKELYLTLQGEGLHTGRPAVFCRFSGCNLWSGREEDRATAICQFCDTDFFGTDGDGGGQFESAHDLAQAIALIWVGDETPFVVCTGGEPLLQMDVALVEALHAFGFEIAVETNGTLPVPSGVDWLCVSPKADTEMVLPAGDELKLVYPQENAWPESYEALDFDHFFLQPMDGLDFEANQRATIEYCLSHPQWKLSAQTHKLIGIR